MKSLNWNILRVTGPLRGIHLSPVPHKGQWRGALMFSLMCACINGWVNNPEAGDLRRHRADYDVIVRKEITDQSGYVRKVDLEERRIFHILHNSS